MGGGALSVKFSAGPLSAHLDAHAEFLMAWNPFHFIGDIGVSIGVTFHTKIWFVSVTISADVSGSLHLEGPPFGGKVHVNFWVFGFDIYFGNQPGPPPPLSLQEFWDLLARSSNQQGAGSDSGITLVVASGYNASKDKRVTPEAGSPWIVAGGQFKFHVQCRFAVSTVKYKLEAESQWDTVATGDVSVYSKPMHRDNAITSELKITITNELSQPVEGFTFTKVLKNVPSAMWGQCAY